MYRGNPPFGELNQYLCTVCYDSLLRETSAYLGYDIDDISHDIQYTIEVDEDTVYYTFRACVHKASVSIEDDENDENYKKLWLTCALRFDEAGCALSVIDAVDAKKETPVERKHYGLKVNQSLLPDLHEDDLREAEAERFLRRYCPEALTTPMPVPIRSIMENKMGLTVVTDIRLLGETYGQILFKNDEQLVMNGTGDDIMVIPYRRGTVLIDGGKVFLYGLGFANYTLAHEAYYWFSHRTYVDFHRIVGAQEGSSYNGLSQYSSTDILEIQANTIASRILMPKDMFLKKYREFAAADETLDADNYKIISSLAAFFHVSFTATAIRLSQLGLLDTKNAAETRSISKDDAFALYANHEDFRELVDSGKLLFFNDAYVINDPKYIEPIWEDVPTYSSTMERCPYQLTEYAHSHPEEALVTFTIDRERISAGSDILLRESADVLLASVEKIRKHFPQEAGRMAIHSKNFEKVFAKVEGKYKSFADVACEMVEYRYGRREDYDAPSLDAREWKPKEEMPEVHKLYFDATRLQALKDKQYELINSEDCDSEKEAALTKAIEKEQALENSICERYENNLAGRELDDDGHIADNSSSPVKLFCADTRQTPQYYTKIMKGKAVNPDARTLMSLCVGLCLSSTAANALFRSAGRVLTWNRENTAYRYILHHLRGEYIEDVNLFLDNLGLKPLGAQRQTKGK